MRRAHFVSMGATLRAVEDVPEFFSARRLPARRFGTRRNACPSRCDGSRKIERAAHARRTCWQPFFRMWRVRRDERFEFVIGGRIRRKPAHQRDVAIASAPRRHRIERAVHEARVDHFERDATRRPPPKNTGSALPPQPRGGSRQGHPTLRAHHKCDRGCRRPRNAPIPAPPVR